MSTQRYVSTSFWDDEWIQTLDPSEKLLYLYFMTNPLTNIAGIYKLSVRRICFDTGFTSDTVGHIMAKFEKAKKSYRLGEYIALPSWPKHQKWETKKAIKDGIDIILKELPCEILDKLDTIGYLYPHHPPIIPPSSPHRPSYSDLDSDSNSDIDLDKDIDSDSPKTFSPNLKNDGTSRIERARLFWNTQNLGPPSRLMAIQMRPDDTSECLRVMAAYSDEDIQEAMRNYGALKDDPAFDCPRYQSFVGFIRGGVEKFVEAATPRELFKLRKKFESAGEREERERAESLAKLEAMP